MGLALDHVVIHVADWERSNAFYRDVLGAELVERDGSAARHYFRDPDGSLLEFLSYA